MFGNVTAPLAGIRYRSGLDRPKFRKLHGLTWCLLPRKMVPPLNISGEAYMKAYGRVVSVVALQLTLAVLTAAAARASDASRIAIHGVGLRMSIADVEQQLKKEFGGGAPISISGDTLTYDADSYVIGVRFVRGVWNGKEGQYSFHVWQRLFNKRMDRDRKPVSNEYLRKFSQQVRAKYGPPDVTAHRPGEIDEGWCDPHKQIDWGGGQRFCNPQYSSLVFSRLSFFPGSPITQLILTDNGFRSQMRGQAGDQTAHH